jgi:twitching motility two-component system response regulator PilG
MPGLDGLSLCRLLRDMPGLNHLRVAVMSGTASEAEAFAAGADAYLSKPFLVSRLLKIVRDLVSPDASCA